MLTAIEFCLHSVCIETKPFYEFTKIEEKIIYRVDSSNGFIERIHRVLIIELVCLCLIYYGMF